MYKNYRNIVSKNIFINLKKGGILAFEIGYDQGEAVSQLMEKQGYSQVQVIQDLAGLDRCVTGIRK